MQHFFLSLVAVPGQQLSFSYTQNTLGVLSGARWSKHLSHLRLGLAVGAPGTSFSRYRGIMGTAFLRMQFVSHFQTAS